VENASVPSNTMWDLLIFSVRYAMGRQTGAVSDMCRHVRVFHKHLEPWQVEQIAREIREEIARAERTERRTLGANCDHEDWIKLAEFLEAV
jgi:hypothetical protein